MEVWVGEDIIIQGDIGDCMYILMEGTVGIVVDGKEVAQQRADLDHDRVHFFGELSLIEEAPRQATVKVNSISATVLKVDIHAVCEAFGSLVELLQEQNLSL